MFEKNPGKLRKYNLACGCEMCKLARKQRKPVVEDKQHSDE